MKFSIELNPIYGWKMQLLEVQSRLRDRIVDTYDFEGSVILNESWLALKISDGMGRNKYRMRTLI